jgi:hypothetical protein
MMSVQDKQLLALEKRQKLFKEAALQVLILTRDASDIRPDSLAFFYIRYRLSGRRPDFTAGYPVRPGYRISG